MVDTEDILNHRQELEMELEYLNENLGSYNRVQRKNVLEYLHTRVKELEEYGSQVEDAKYILNDDNEK
jgi:hypothetical protein|tara:strand:- start:194 stop:397 length:204 start_codon:yes stop_codon:yes gene_type:complete